MATQKQIGFYYLDDIIERDFVLPESTEIQYSYAVFGNNLNNHLTGNSTGNVLVGGEGQDTLVGGDGNDFYGVDNVGDVVVEMAGGGHDTVVSSVSYTLSANVENLVLGKSIYIPTGSGLPGMELPALDVANINGTGNALDNSLQGNDGNNVLSGLAGNDTMFGGNGADTLIGGSGDDMYTINSLDDVVVEDANGGNDIVYVMVEDYDLSKLVNIETVRVLGTGPSYTGILGSDDHEMFIFNQKMKKNAKAKVLSDFDAGEDQILLSKSVFSLKGKKGVDLAKSAFFSGKHAKDASDRIGYDKKSGKLFFDRDGDGTDYKAVNFAKIDAGLKHLNSHDFHVI